MRHDPAEAGMFTPVADVGSFNLRFGKAGPVPSGDFIAETLAAVVAEMQPGWIVLQDCVLDPDDTYGPGLIRYALLHGKVGIALLDFVPGDVTPNAAHRLRLTLDAAGFTTEFGKYPPIIYLCIPKRTVPSLAWVLEHEFSKQAPVALPRDGAWTHLAQQVLAGERKPEPLAPAAAGGERQNPTLSKAWRQPSGARRQSRSSRWHAGFVSLLALTLAGTAVLHFAAPAGSRMAMLGLGSPDGAAGPLSWPPGTSDAMGLASGLVAAEPPRIVPANPADSLSARMAEEPRLAAIDTSNSQQASEDGLSSPAPSREADSQAAAVTAPSSLPWEGPQLVDHGDGQASQTYPIRPLTLVPGLSEVPVQTEAAQSAGLATSSDGEGTDAPSPTPELSAPVLVPSLYSANSEARPAQAVAASDVAPAPVDRPEAAGPPASEGAPNENSAMAVAAERAVMPAADVPPSVAAAIRPVSGLVTESLAAASADQPTETTNTPPIPTATASQPDAPAPNEIRIDDRDMQVRSSVSTAQMRAAPDPLPPTNASAGLPEAQGVLAGSAGLRGSTEKSDGANVEAQRRSEDVANAKLLPNPQMPEREPFGDAQPQPVPAAAAPSQALPSVTTPISNRHAEQLPPVPVAATSPLATEPQAMVPPGNPAFARAVIQRGDAMIRLGDISAARLLYQRAATAGSGEAAIAMGRTYDPAFLAATRAQGIQGDRALAATWYRRAIALGVAEARDRLAELDIREDR
jgi:hypothetical protein